MTQEGSRRLAAVWFADIVGYTELSASDEDAALRTVRELQHLARTQCEARGGRVVKQLGDAVLTTFGSADGAVRAALHVRDGFMASAAVKATGVSLRVGVHVGDVTEGVDGDVYGDAVNVASRVEGVAAAGQVVITDVTYRLLQQRAAIDVESLGAHELKGVPEPVELYAAQLTDAEDAIDIRELLQDALAPLQVLDVEGIGGMGEIYLARDPSLRRTLAVKVLRSELAADANARARFAREAQVIAGLSHPNVVGVHSVGELKDGTPYFVMDYVQGGSLADRLERDGPLSVMETKRIVGEVAAALQAAHARGVVHRDIKASNILLSRSNGRALVSDWGIAALDPGMVEMAPDDRLTQTGMIIGSPRYMSPEQLAGDYVGSETDMYSLGLLAFELLTGQGPFPAETPREFMVAHLREDPPELSSVREDVDPELDVVVLQCLSKTPEERPTAEEVASRFAPGAVLEWPPPGLEHLNVLARDDGRKLHYVVLIATVPMVLALSARIDWRLAEVLQDVFSGPLVAIAFLAVVGALGFGMLFGGEAYWGELGVRFDYQSSEEAEQARGVRKGVLELGYGWFTLLEVAADQRGEVGRLIAGVGEFVVLSPEERQKTRIRRVRRWVGRHVVLLVAPLVMMLALFLGRVDAVPPSAALLVGLSPWLVYMGIRILPLDPKPVRDARFQLLEQSEIASFMAPRVEAWHDELHRATRGQEVRPGRPLGSNSVWAYISLLGFAAVMTLWIAGSVAFPLLGGSINYGTRDFGPVRDLFEPVLRNEALLVISTPIDAAAGDSLLAAMLVAEDELDWKTSRLEEGELVESPLPGPELTRPYSLTVRALLPAAARGLSEAERQYLGGFVGDPRLDAFDSFASLPVFAETRADRYPEDELFPIRPLRVTGPLRDVAFHKLAQAALALAEGDPTRADHEIRRIFTVGYLLATGANELELALAGRTLTAIALDALEQLSVLVVPDVARVESFRSGPSSGALREARYDFFGRWASQLAVANDTTAVRAVRIAAMANVIPVAECASLDGVVLGRQPRLEEAINRLQEELVRTDADRAFLDMAVDFTARWRAVLHGDDQERVGRLVAGERLPWVVRFPAELVSGGRLAHCFDAIGGPI